MLGVGGGCVRVGGGCVRGGWRVNNLLVFVSLLFIASKPCLDYSIQFEVVYFSTTSQNTTYHGKKVLKVV